MENALDFGVVRYDKYLSSRFHVCAGVRQGGVLSPVLFSVFMNSLHTGKRSGSVGQIKCGFLAHVHLSSPHGYLKVAFLATKISI